MVFGKPQAWLYLTEWQKCGLPHYHLLLWLSADHRISPDKIDDVICAEIPDTFVDPELHQINCYVQHGTWTLWFHQSQFPLHARWSVYAKVFKQYMAETQIGAESYPLYRRSSPDSGGQVSTISMRIGVSRVNQIDNRWIFPYKNCCCDP